MHDWLKQRTSAIILGLGAVTILSLPACKQAEEPAANNAAAVTNEAPTIVENVAAPTEFSIESVPVSTATLPPPPFFTDPEGLTNVLKDNEKVVTFGEQIFLAGIKPVRMEGKIYRQVYNLADTRPYSVLEFHKNYENAIAALGGKKINESQWNNEMFDAVGGYEAASKMNYGQGLVRDYRHDYYLIRTADKEYWIDISTGSIPLHGSVVVLEKTGMAQSVGFLDASQMKKAIDATGRVALQINFDLDKATIRPDAQPILAEINTLLTQNPSLRLSIEGHTDNTGDAAHNRTLSNARARSVLGALVGLGIDASRLTSKGFGPDKPVADNSHEDGRAKNRRVELVKI